VADDAVDESYVQVATDGSGKKIRNLVRAKLVLDSVPDANADQNRYIQVVVLADRDGNLIEPDKGWREALLDEQRTTNQLLAEILERLR
jgi:hypothetical protein